MASEIEKDLKKLIENYLDEKSTHFYTSKKQEQKNFIKTISTESFEKEIIKNTKVKECVIEVFKKDCPSCAFNGKVYNAFSQKLKKHGVDLPCFRLCIDNKVPFLGTFSYSPIYLHVKKNEKGQIEEIRTLDPPQRFSDFIEGLPIPKDRIKLHPLEQVKAFVRQEDLLAGFDIDFDLAKMEKEAKFEVK